MLLLQIVATSGQRTLGKVVVGMCTGASWGCAPASVSGLKMISVTPLFESMLVAVGVAALALLLAAALLTARR